MSELDWKEAEEHFYTMKGIYEETFLGEFALVAVFRPLEIRYKAGERTEELYREMLEVEA